MRCRIQDGETGISRLWKRRKKLVVTGEISKALGEYDSHLRGAVEYLICGQDGKEYESIIVVDATAKEVHDSLSKLGVEVGTPPGYDMEKRCPNTTTRKLLLPSLSSGKDGDKTKKVRAEELVLNVKTQKTAAAGLLGFIPVHVSCLT